MRQRQSSVLILISVFLFAVFISSANAQVSSCPFTRSLSRGVSGNDVKALQNLLISQKFLASGLATGYFGTLTEKALQKWQAQNKIVYSGTPSTTGYGLFGPKSRRAITASCSSVPPASLNFAPKTSVVSATSAVPSVPAKIPPVSKPPSLVAPVYGGGGGGFAPAPALKSCSFNGQTIASGASVKAYTHLSVPSGSCSSVEQTRTCADGILSGTAGYGSCSVATTATSSVPTASFTANGAKDITVNTGDTVNFIWSSSNAVSASSYVADDSASCGRAERMVSTPWVANTLNGSISGVIPQCQSGHAYTITYVATDSAGKTASDTVVVRVKVSGSIQITKQPSGGTFETGSSPVWSVAATGTSLQYRWQKQSGNSWVDMPGTSFQFGITNIQELDEGTYRVKIYNTAQIVYSNSFDVIVTGHNIVPNPDFSSWSTEPASRWVQTQISQAFSLGSIADGWYGGPGPNGVYGFTRGVFDPNQTFIPGYPKYYGIFVYVTPPTSGSVTEYTRPRAPIFELGADTANSIISFSEMVGHKWKYTFYGRVQMGTFDVVPVLWVSNGQIGWLPGQPKNIGDYVMAWPYTYRATSKGTTGTTAPSGTTVNQSDGGVNWEFVGYVKGRAYDVYESGPNAAGGSVYASTHTGDPHQGAVCTLTTSWSKCSITINVPAPGYVNSSDYIGSGDSPRTLLPESDNRQWGGYAPYGGVALDFINLPSAGLMVELSHFSVTRED